MHKDIKRFGVEGETDDVYFSNIRRDMEHQIIREMRDSGYIPYLDVGPHFSTSIRGDGKFDFKLSIYGIYVGRKRSKEYQAISDNRGLIPFTTPTNQ